MMKKALLYFSIMLSGLFLYSQEEEVVDNSIPIDPNTKLITFQEVVQQEGTKKDLFNRASEWLHHFFKQPVYVTQVRDASSGVIKGKHQFELNRFDKDGKHIAGMIKYYFKIECRDDRYRYTLDNFTLTRQSKYPCERWLDTNDPNYSEEWPDYLQQLRTYSIDVFAASLKDYMVPEEKVEEEEW